MNDVVTANAAIADGRLEKIFQSVSKIISPENSFFYSDNGYRAALMIFEMKDSSQIPQIAEPFFNELNAKVEIIPTMDVHELKIGLDAWKKQSPNYSSLS